MQRIPYSIAVLNNNIQIQYKIYAFLIFANPRRC